MVEHYSNILSIDDINYILALNEVTSAKNQIDIKSSGQVYFSVSLTESIKSAINKHLGLDLSNINSIPMRWVKGDTLPHIDHGIDSFDNTYLMYLTNSLGELIIDSQSYPITQGHAYVFNEGLHHETINTGLEPRLLLGPMSEEGFAVGQAIPLDIFIRQDGANVQYSEDQETWNNIDVWPFNFLIRTVTFISNITLTVNNQYFICSNNNIQFGSESLREDGSRPIITIDGVDDYPGLIQNVGEPAYENIYIFNLEINVINSTLATYCGWFTGDSFGIYTSGSNYIINCSSNGNIPNNCGGIVGRFATVNIIGCSSSGIIGDNAGGIIGPTFGSALGTDIFIKCESCWSTGNLNGMNSGGIVGAGANSNNGSISIINCYSTGAISGNDSGGIVAESATNFTIENCYSRGNISGTNSGGIVASNITNITITNCYTTGNNTGATSGGICGPSPTNTTITHCYTSGTASNGYIIGGDNEIPSNCYSEAENESSGWNSTNANQVLNGLPAPVVGSVWVVTTLNQPYELYNMGYTPYTNKIIQVSQEYSLIRTFPLYGNKPVKDMNIAIYTDEIDPQNFQDQLFSDMADFVDGNIVVGDKNPDDRLNASYWNDLGNDVFDDWGYFYLYDITSQKYYFPIFNPLNQENGIMTTQTFNAFGRTFIIEHGWSAQGIFKFDISVNDNLPFRFGAYGEIGSAGNENIEDLVYYYNIGDETRKLHYHRDSEEGDNIEQLFSYFIPKNQSENDIQPYDVYYYDDVINDEINHNDKMSMVTKDLTTGLIIYFAKSNNVVEWVINELKGFGNDKNIVNKGNNTEGAIITGRSYTILQILNELEEIYTEGTITIDSATGIISTTSETPIGIYTIFIRNTGSYHITTYTLIVTEESSTIIPGLQKVLINSLNNGDNIISDIEIKIFNSRIIKVNDMYKNTNYINLIRDIHRNELNKLMS
jgi:hypothetical protein